MSPVNWMKIGLVMMYAGALGVIGTLLAIVFLHQVAVGKFLLLGAWAVWFTGKTIRKFTFERSRRAL